MPESSSHYSRFASNPFNYPEDQPSLSSSSSSSASSSFSFLSSSCFYCWPASYLFSSPSDPERGPPSVTNAPTSPSASVPGTNPSARPSGRLASGYSASSLPESNASTTSPSSATSSGKTTFSFVLFGLTLAGALAVTVRTRRNMHRFLASKNVALRDARAWRKVALEMAKANAVATSRVESLMSAALGEQQPDPKGSAARAFHDELEQARRRARAMRARLRDEQPLDHDGFESSIRPDRSRDGRERDQHGSTKEGAGSVRSGFFFGGSAPGSAWADFLSGSGTSASPFQRERRWPPFSATTIRSEARQPERAEAVTPRPTEPSPPPSAPCSNASKGATLRSPEERWRRAAGLSAGTSPSISADQPQGTSKVTHERDQDWLGNIDDALQDQQQKVQAETKADPPRLQADTGQEVESLTAEEEDWLLPVSDLHIASRHYSIAEDILNEADLQSSVPVRKGPAWKAGKRVIEKGTTKELDERAEEAKVVGVSGERSSSSLYPTVHRYSGLEDVLMEAWADEWCVPFESIRARRSEQAALAPSAKDGEQQQSQAKVEASDEVPITWTRSKRSPAKMTSLYNSDGKDDPEQRARPASASMRTDEPLSRLAKAVRSSQAKKSLASQKREQEASASDVQWFEAPEQDASETAREDEQAIPEEPKRTTVRTRSSGNGSGESFLDRALSSSTSSSSSSSASPASFSPSAAAVSDVAPPSASTDSTAVEAQRLQTAEVEALREENKHIKVKLMELETLLDSLRRERAQEQGEAEERANALKEKIEALEGRVGMMNVWAEEVHRRMGLKDPYLGSGDWVGSR